MTAPPRPAAAGPDGAAPGAGRLRADRVSLGYGRLPVVDGLSFDVPPGQVTSIIGPNGCGKSTLLRALVRLLKPRGGAVLLDGHDARVHPDLLQQRQQRRRLLDLALLAVHLELNHELPFPLM